MLISGTKRLTCATPQSTKSVLPRRVISRLSRVAPSALAWYTCTSTWPFVSSATSCLNFSALRPHACSLELGDENLSTYVGCAAALMASAARTITAITLASIFRMAISL